MSGPSNQTIFKGGPVPGGTLLADDDIGGFPWSTVPQINGNQGCHTFMVCAEDSLRWNVEFNSPDPNQPVNEWHGCVLTNAGYQPVPFKVWFSKNGNFGAEYQSGTLMGQSQLGSNFYLVQNAAPAGDGRNCQND